ncbi:hypothetical protein HJG60_008836 [Phyllostomus discolor]|uniref:Uncharacterized protein n=1 Tax=Phyllostomus discolor TaxID=89673 RepID=A0A834DJ74_9CHIR|nr:hypothetical protein HJG60_008836 [Phyllostomus discolor]
MWPHWRPGNDSGGFVPPKLAFQSQCVACQVVTEVPWKNVSLGGDQMVAGVGGGQGRPLGKRHLCGSSYRREQEPAGLWDSVLSGGPKSAKTLGVPEGHEGLEPGGELGMGAETPQQDGPLNWPASFPWSSPTCTPRPGTGEGTSGTHPPVWVLVPHLPGSALLP